MTLRDILTPEAHKDPYQWVTAFGAHYWVAMGPWGLVAIWLTQWEAAIIIPLVYLVAWEGVQLYRTPGRSKALIWDSVLDSVGVAMACYSAACLGNGLRVEAVSCWSASVVVAAVGWRVREARKRKALFT